MSKEHLNRKPELKAMAEDFRNATGRILLAGTSLGMITWPIFLEEMRPYGVITIPLGILFFAIAYKLPTEQQIAERKAHNAEEKIKNANRGEFEV